MHILSLNGVDYFKCSNGYGYAQNQIFIRNMQPLKDNVEEIVFQNKDNLFFSIDMIQSPHCSDPYYRNPSGNKITGFVRKFYKYNNKYNIVADILGQTEREWYYKRIGNSIETGVDPNVIIDR